VTRRLRRIGCGCALFSGICLVALPVLLVSSCHATAAATNSAPAIGTASASGAPVANLSRSGGALGVAVRTSVTRLFPWTPPGGLPTASWPWGQCTWFVVYEGHAYGNHRVTWGGNADSWYANARSQGIPTEPASSVPEPGWIAVYAPGHGSDPHVGHVAAIVGVQVTSGTYTVAEMNVLGLGVADLRTLRLDGSNPLLEGWIQ
jgi:hypothetical protein